MISGHKALAALAKASAQQEALGRQVAIAIADDHGELIAYIRMDGASFQAGVLAQSKAYTAARDRQPTANLGEWSRSSGRAIAYWTDPKITGFGGGLPVVVDGKVVGGVGVSGLSEADDAGVAELVISLLA